jgi:hypothetical protein
MRPVFTNKINNLRLNQGRLLTRARFGDPDEHASMIDRKTKNGKFLTQKRATTKSRPKRPETRILLG